MDRSGSTQSCREQKNGQNEWAELFFICQVCIYREKKNLGWLSIQPLLYDRERTTTGCFSFFFFFPQQPIEMHGRSSQSAVLRN